MFDNWQLTIGAQVQTWKQLANSFFRLVNYINFINEMGLRMGNGMSPCYFAFLRGEVSQDITKSC